MAILLASLLDANWGNLGDEVRAVEEAGVDGISLDITDGEFVPRFTFGPHIASVIRNITSLPIEVHLMVANPEKFVEPFCDAGGDQIIFHIETTDDPMSIISYVKNRGLCVGIALKQETPLSVITDEVLSSIDAINLMAVPVGYGGQSPTTETFNRIKELRARSSIINPDLAIEIDGGMKPNNCGAYVNAGADVIIMGTGIYKAPNYHDPVEEAKAHLKVNNEISSVRLQKFISQPSTNLIDDMDRRKRLDQIRIALDIAETSWNPLTSKR